MDAGFFGQLGGVDAAVTALGRRAGVRSIRPSSPRFASMRPIFLTEAERGDPRDRLLEIEPEPVIDRGDAQLTDIAAAFAISPT